MTPFGLYNNKCARGGGRRCNLPVLGGGWVRGTGWGWGTTFNIVVGVVFQMGCAFLVTLWFLLPRVAVPFFSPCCRFAGPSGGRCHLLCPRRRQFGRGALSNRPHSAPTWPLRGQTCLSPPGFATVLLETWGQERKERKLDPSPPDSGRLK